MNRHDLLRKIANDQPLTPAEEAWLDAELAQEQAVPSCLKSLPEETPSLAWRSSLNEQLRALAPAASARPRRLWKWLTGGSLALGVASSIALVLIWQHRAGLTSPAPSPQVAPSVEAALIAAHQEGMSQIEFSAPSKSSASGSNTATEEFQWSEVDLESL
ncbi:MAG TPA: hypothetical protein PLO61_05235 [Fimbriimonadaceae bacterium]|nr:hypothetical protein [Fimbriimonadaceae bacterium]HRJ33085.1 hypothetical protein [Fimbriimonadaceae bacterium]